MKQFRGWKQLAQFVKDAAIIGGHLPDLRLCFLDHIPGPSTQEFKAGMPDTGFDELAEYKKLSPQHDWDAIFAGLDGGKPSK